MATKIILGGGGLTHEDLVTIAVHGAEVVLEPKMEKEVCINEQTLDQPKIKFWYKKISYRTPNISSLIFASE